MKLKHVKEVKTKGEARQLAIDWQSWVNNKNLSYYETAEWAGFFISLARKFRLTKEFKENGII